MHSIFELRVAVAHLGERAGFGWWDTGFLNPTGFRFLQLVFPKTAAAACVTAVSEAAGREHDERIGKGRVAHLFRLNEDVELKLRADLTTVKSSDLEKICSKEGAFQALAKIAGDAETVTGNGPFQIGSIKELEKAATHSRLAAAYAAAFHSGTKIFPYFA